MVTNAMLNTLYTLDGDIILNIDIIIIILSPRQINITIFSVKIT